MIDKVKEIKTFSHYITQKLAQGIDETQHYLKWFNQLPEQYKDYAVEVYIIFERLNFGLIGTDEAKTLYDVATVNFQNQINTSQP